MKPRTNLRIGTASGAAALMLSMTAYSAQEPAKSIPDFFHRGRGLDRAGREFPTAAGRTPPSHQRSGPRFVKRHRFQCPRPAEGRERASTFRVADLTNPILQPWAREELKKRNERILSGGTGYTRQVSCWPMGVPAFLLYPAQPLYVVQGPKQVLLIAQMNNEPRHVYLNVPHSRNVKPSWYGESVGHYEGDTLVVDTIGMNDQDLRRQLPHAAQREAACG